LHRDELNYVQFSHGSFLWSTVLGLFLMQRKLPDVTLMPAEFFLKVAPTFRLGMQGKSLYIKGALPLVQSSIQ
jgi:hypothetical protein